MKFEKTITTTLHKSGRTTFPKFYRDKFKDNTLYIQKHPNSDHSIIRPTPPEAIYVTKNAPGFVLNTVIHFDANGSMRLPVWFSSRLEKGVKIYFFGAGDHIKMLTEEQYANWMNRTVEISPKASPKGATTTSSKAMTEAILGKSRIGETLKGAAATFLGEKTELVRALESVEPDSDSYPHIVPKEEFPHLNIHEPASPNHRIHIIRQNRESALEAATAVKSELEIIISEMSNGHNGGPPIEDEGVMEFDALKELKGMRDILNTAIKFLEDNLSGGEWREERWKDITHMLDSQLTHETKENLKAIGRHCLGITLKKWVNDKLAASDE